MDLKEIRWKGECVNWIHLAQDKGLVASSCEYNNTLSCAIMNELFLQYQNNK